MHSAIIESIGNKVILTKSVGAKQINSTNNESGVKHPIMLLWQKLGTCVWDI